jgi:hypothetical protein
MPAIPQAAPAVGIIPGGSGGGGGFAAYTMQTNENSGELETDVTWQDIPPSGSLFQAVEGTLFSLNTASGYMTCLVPGDYQLIATGNVFAGAALSAFVAFSLDNDVPLGGVLEPRWQNQFSAGATEQWAQFTTMRRTPILLDEVVSLVFRTTAPGALELQMLQVTALRIGDVP